MSAKNKGVFKRTYVYYKKYMPAFWFGIFCALAGAFFGILMPQVTQLIIDRIVNPALGSEPVYSDSNILSFLLNGFSPDDYFGMLTVMLIALAVVCFARYIIHYSRWNVEHRAMMYGENKIRDYAFSKMLRQSPTVLNKYSSGDLLNVTNNDPTAIKDLYLQHFPCLIGWVFNIVFALVFLIALNPFLAIVPICTGMISVVVVRRYNRILRKKYDTIRRGNVELNTYIQENINGVRVIRAYATEEDERKRFLKRNATFRDNYIDLARVSAKYNMIFTVIGEGVSMMSLILGIILAANGYISVGEFATFSAYCWTINSSLTNVSGTVGNIQNGVVCANRFFEFSDRPLEVVDVANPVPVPQKPDISLNNVSMSFGIEGRPALKNITVDIPYGKRVGIMGKTGSGKSVFMKLLMRYYDCTDGSISMSGTDIREMPVEEVRRQFSFVMQDVFLFSDTVSGNIALYDEDATDEQIKKCAVEACVDKFAPALSDGYETVVGEKGLGLSGGQKQRVSIARALLKNAPVILLDDCTSALDYETEKEITKNLFDSYGDRTMIVSSHRAGSVAYCDEILYFEDGVIVERGTHDELMAQKGRYYEIFSEQESMNKEALD